MQLFFLCKTHKTQNQTEMHIRMQLLNKVELLATEEPN